MVQVLTRQGKNGRWSAWNSSKITRDSQIFSIMDDAEDCIREVLAQIYIFPIPPVLIEFPMLGIHPQC